MKLGADGKKWHRQQLSTGKTKAWVLTQQCYFMNLEGSGPKCFTRICCCLPSWTIQGTPYQLKFLGMQAVGWKMFSPPSLKGKYVSQRLQKGRTGTQLCLGVVCSSRMHWAWPVMRFFLLINSLDTLPISAFFQSNKNNDVFMLRFILATSSFILCTNKIIFFSLSIE